MNITKRHEWVTTIEEAKLIQQQLQPEVITENKLGEIRDGMNYLIKN